MPPTYPLRIPIETNHGRGETRSIGPTRVTFAIAALFDNGEPLRFAIALRGHGNHPIDVVGSGRVESVRVEDALFVVDASIDQTQITFAGSDDAGERDVCATVADISIMQKQTRS